MKKQGKKETFKMVLRLLAAAALLAAAVILIVRYAPQLKHLLTSRETIRSLERLIESFGILGIPVLLFLQVLQVFIAIIPSEPIEVTAGICYGGFWGFVLCLAGVGLGSLLVFLLIKRFGTPLVQKLASEKKLKEFHFLENVRRMEGITFLLYFIPGLPKDVFTYFAALTPMTTRSFLLISLTARIPSVLVSTIAGDQYIQGNYKTTLWIFAIFAAVGVIGMIGYKLISARLNKRAEEKQDDGNKKV